MRTPGERDRVHVTRSDGSEVSWVFPTYGDGLPHDLVHLVVESVFGLRRGFWGRVDGGADPGRIGAEANRRGGRDKYAALGPDQEELQLAEVLAANRWWGDDPAEDLRRASAEAGLVAPALSGDRVNETREALRTLRERWAALPSRGALSVNFHAAEPRQGLPALGM